MPRICLVLVAGLDVKLLEESPDLQVFGSLRHRTAYRTALPAVTSTAQATLLTGVSPALHGIIANGLYTHNRPELRPMLDLSNHAEARANVSFWEQSAALLQSPRFWEGTGKKVAMLFWQNAIGAAEVVLTPKPTHTPDGKTVSACYSEPASLYPELVQALGPFPLHQYWSPMAGLGSSAWIAKAATHVWQHHPTDLQLVYVPHMDYNLQRLGPDHPQIKKDLLDVDALLLPLVQQVRANGDILIIAGDYGISAVKRAVTPNIVLRQAGLLRTKADSGGKLLVDYDASDAFAMVDHQVAHVYIKTGREPDVWELFRQTPGIGKMLRAGEELRRQELDNSRSGQLVLLASSDAWFAHDWWLSEDEKPAWQFSVDIHNKPGFDPRELFFDPARKCIAQALSLPQGSHGLVDDRERDPVLLSDLPLPAAMPMEPRATSIAPWLKSLLISS